MQICSTRGYGGDDISGYKDRVPAFLKLVELPSLAAMVTLTKSAGLQKWERKCLFLPTGWRGTQSGMILRMRDVDEYL